MAKLTKKQKSLVEKLGDNQALHGIDDAIQLLKDLKSAKFDESLEVSLNLGVDPRHADQMVRGMVVLPSGTGKDVKVAVFARGDKAEAALAAGADKVGAEDLLEDMQAGNLDYGRVIATPDMMGIVGRLGRVLGPQGKMPNPKSGTITFEIAKAVEDVKSGKIEYRTENRAGLIHVAIGKRSFDETQLVENYASVLEELLRVRPASAKGRYIKTITLATTMGPGIKLDPTRTRDLLEEKEAVAV